MLLTAASTPASNFGLRLTRALRAWAFRLGRALGWKAVRMFHHPCPGILIRSPGSALKDPPQYPPGINDQDLDVSVKHCWNSLMGSSNIKLRLQVMASILLSGAQDRTSSTSSGMPDKHYQLLSDSSEWKAGRIQFASIRLAAQHPFSSVLIPQPHLCQSHGFLFPT